MPPEDQNQNLELAGLHGLAAEVDGNAAAVAAPGDPNAPAMPEAPPDYATSARASVDLFGGMVCGFAPEAEPLWGEATKVRMAASLAPVFEKYGWHLGEAPCELVAIAICGPVLYQSAKLVAVRINADKAPKVQDSQGVMNSQAGAVVADAAPDPLISPQLPLYQK